MKALVVINESLVPVHGGGVPRTLSIIHGLRWYGHEVYVVASTQKETKETTRVLGCSGFFPIAGVFASLAHA